MNRIKLIAEIGINHDGDLDIARRLVAAAIESGATAVKFQYRNLGRAYASADPSEIGDEILNREIRKNYLTPAVLMQLAGEVAALGAEPGISFFHAEDIGDFPPGLPQFTFTKQPSAELLNFELTDCLLAMGKPLYLSTGCHTEPEIEGALGRLPPAAPWMPLHCISNYPSSLANARTGYITHLAKRWSRPVGYSSHDDDWEVCLLALAAGATTLERHITFDRQAPGLDHSTSSTPAEFAKLTRFLRHYDLISAGNGPRVPNQGEWLNRQNLGRAYFAAKPLPTGHALALEDLSYRSPNIGLNCSDIGDFLGQPLQQDVPAGAPLVRSLFAAPAALPDDILAFAQARELALPVRLHDYADMAARFPVGAFEFHLSFTEALSQVDFAGLDRRHRFSLHLPDYVSSTELMDPFARDPGHRERSLRILSRTVALAARLQDLTGRDVPIVGSFSVVHAGRADFFADHAGLLARYRSEGVEILPQWLPPIAWYFGGSVQLDVMNDCDDLALLIRHELPFCLDVCHLILGRNLFHFDTDQMLRDAAGLVRHVHLADAAGIDGEGLGFGEGEPENVQLIGRAIDLPGMKVIEVWQGHLDQGAGFRKALHKLSELYGHVH